MVSLVCKKEYGPKRPMVQCSWCSKVFCQIKACSGNSASDLKALDKIPTSAWTCNRECYEAIDISCKENATKTVTIKQLQNELHLKGIEFTELWNTAITAVNQTKENNAAKETMETTIQTLQDQVKMEDAKTKAATEKLEEERQQRKNIQEELHK